MKDEEECSLAWPDLTADYTTLQCAGCTIYQYFACIIRVRVRVLSPPPTCDCDISFCLIGLADNYLIVNEYRNAGLFIWMDLSPYLPVSETNGDGWAAQRLLSDRLQQAGVYLSDGGTYRAPTPGKFRLVFSVDEDILREGIKR